MPSCAATTPTPVAIELHQAPDRACQQQAGSYQLPISFPPLDPPSMSTTNTDATFYPTWPDAAHGHSKAMYSTFCLARNYNA